MENSCTSVMAIVPFPDLFQTRVNPRFGDLPCIDQRSQPWAVDRIRPSLSRCTGLHDCFSSRIPFPHKPTPRIHRTAFGTPFIPRLFDRSAGPLVRARSGAGKTIPGRPTSPKSISARSDKSRFIRDHHQLGTITRPQLHEDAAHMGLGGGRAHVQLFGQLLV